MEVESDRCPFLTIRVLRACPGAIAIIIVLLTALQFEVSVVGKIKYFNQYTTMLCLRGSVSEHSPLTEICRAPFLSGFRGHCTREGGKTVRARGRGDCCDTGVPDKRPSSHPQTDQGKSK